jgi:pseudouridine kinase
MKVCVIGGANIDITTISRERFMLRDSNPGTVRLSFGGVGRNIAHNLALLGDAVCFVTRFGGDAFGQMLRVSCREIGMDISLCETCPTLPSACFASINDCDGSMVGGVADMIVTESISTDWLAVRIDAINRAEAVVADTNLLPETLAWLIDNVRIPLYIDAVSGPKSVRLAKALDLSVSKRLYAFKCNALEIGSLASITGFARRYVTRGEQGLEVTADGTTTLFPAIPCTVRNTTGGGDALLAGIVHAGPDASVEESARVGLLCARCAVESDDAVNEALKNVAL